MSVLVLGLGNSLMSDDAFGVRVVEELQRRYVFPPDVKIIDGGTLGFDLLPFVEEADRLLIVDALQMQAEPGEVFRLAGDEVPRAFASKLSVHQMGVQDLLAVAELQGYCPRELVVWGVQWASIEMNIGLTPAVAPALERVVNEVVGELKEWGIEAQDAA